MLKKTEEENALNKNNSNGSPKAYGSFPSSNEYPKQLLSPPKTNYLKQGLNWMGSWFGGGYSDIDSAPKNK